MHDTCDVCSRPYTRRAPNQRLCGDIACKRKAKRDRQAPPGAAEYRAFTDVYRDAEGKVCRGCDQYRTWADYYPVAKNRDGYISRCRSCTLAQVATRYAAETADASSAEVMRLKNKASRYGVTVDELIALEAATDCARCREPLGPSVRQRAIDHDHDTRRVRGVCCIGCNTGMGKVAENLAEVDITTEYLLRRVDVLALASGL